MRTTKTIHTCLLTLAAASMATVGTVSTAAAMPAAAPSAVTTQVEAAAACDYPYVCLFKSGKKIGQFKDVTSSYQNLPSRPSGPNLVVANTRKDDVVHIRRSSGGVTCLAPNRAITFNSGVTLTGIRISSASSCG
ncbi:hypothetical protein ABT001_26535 [Streptomyces sp. NPDC002793]|uniref:hypothetical protein n=1 Tax=Streptomyces sp. NPDC002793 TaxID=3154432 RepID=UPI00332E8C94